MVEVRYFSKCDNIQYTYMIARECTFSQILLSLFSIVLRSNTSTYWFVVRSVVRVCIQTSDVTIFVGESGSQPGNVYYHYVVAIHFRLNFKISSVLFYGNFNKIQ